MSTIRDIMSTDLLAVDPSTTVAQAATMMAQHHVGSALVCEEDRLVGIFTERDIVRALSHDFDAPGHPVGSWMTRNPTTVGPDTTVEEALDRMLTGGFRHLPVETEGKAVGVVSMRDISRASAQRPEG